MFWSASSPERNIIYESSLYSNTISFVAGILISAIKIHRKDKKKSMKNFSSLTISIIHFCSPYTFSSIICDFFNRLAISVKISYIFADGLFKLNVLLSASANPPPPQTRYIFWLKFFYSIESKGLWNIYNSERVGREWCRYDNFFVVLFSDIWCRCDG